MTDSTRKTFVPQSRGEGEQFNDLDDEGLYSVALSEGVMEEVFAEAEHMAPAEFRDYLIGLLEEYDR
jgi:hypothetical protein